MEKISRDPNQTKSFPYIRLDTAAALASADVIISPGGVSKKTEAEGCDKRPLIGRWEIKTTTDQLQIRQWSQTYPNAVPGITAGGGEQSPLRQPSAGERLGIGCLPKRIAFHSQGGSSKCSRPANPRGERGRVKCGKALL